jgi:hypothetical protein
MTPPQRSLPAIDLLPESDRPLQVQAARKSVEEAASASRLVGGVFVALGVLLVVPVLQRRMRGGLQALAVANAIVLVGPGVWYFLAAALLRRLERRAATIAIRVAVTQGVFVATGLGLAGFVDSRRAWAGVSTPALLAIFFMPALAALVFHLWRAREAMNLLGGGETGFEALGPRPVIPLEPEDFPEGAPSRVQGSESFRGK